MAELLSTNCLWAHGPQNRFEHRLHSTIMRETAREVETTSFFSPVTVNGLPDLWQREQQQPVGAGGGCVIVARATAAARSAAAAFSRASSSCLTASMAASRTLSS